MKIIAVALAAMALSSPLAFAQLPEQPVQAEKSAQQLSQCLIQNSGEEEKQLMRDFMLAALQEQRDKANQSMMTMGMGIAMTATSECGWQMSDMQGPAFEQGAALYGEFLGTQIMEEAMGSIGMQ